MTALLLATLGLGIGGLDPAGALMAVGALAAGARPRDVATFAVVVLLGSASFGVLATLTIGTRLHSLSLNALRPRGILGAGVELAVGVVLLAWVWRRAHTRPRERTPAPRSGLILAGVGYAALSLTDPTFAGTVVLAGRGYSVPAVLVAFVLWSLVSQAPLTVLLAAVLTGAHEPAVRWFRLWWARVGPRVRTVVTVVLGVSGFALVIDAAVLAVTGHATFGVAS